MPDLLTPPAKDKPASDGGFVTVEIPGYGPVDFPDTMSQDAIDSAVGSLRLQAQEHEAKYRREASPGSAAEGGPFWWATLAGGTAGLAESAQQATSLAPTSPGFINSLQIGEHERALIETQLNDSYPDWPFEQARRQEDVQRSQGQMDAMERDGQGPLKHTMTGKERALRWVAYSKGEKGGDILIRVPEGAEDRVAENMRAERKGVAAPTWRLATAEEVGEITLSDETEEVKALRRHFGPWHCRPSRKHCLLHPYSYLPLREWGWSGGRLGQVRRHPPALAQGDRGV